MTQYIFRLIQFDNGYIENCFGRKSKLIEIQQISTDSQSNLNIQTISNHKYIAFSGSETHLTVRSSTWSVFLRVYVKNCQWFTVCSCICVCVCVCSWHSNQVDKM